MKKIAVVTGTRADYGLLKPVIENIQINPDLALSLLVTGMHMSPEFGLTYKEIENDGYSISAKIEMLLSADTPSGIMKSMGIEMISFADVFEREQPDLLLILGDRFEALVAAVAAMVNRIPIAHIAGGELTEGAIDEAIRHSITKMSHLHFTATDVYRKRVIQLGEQPQNVYNVGALGVDNVKKVKLLDKNELEEEIGFEISSNTIMLTYHPVTLENMTAYQQFKNILGFLDRHREFRIIFTKANSDMDGRTINKMIDEYVKINSDRCVAYTSMGQLRYLSALRFCCAVVGNSSSGIVEAPSFHVPTINIGDRQKGRIHGKSVISCSNDIEDIERAFQQIRQYDFRELIKNTKNPYEGKDTAEQIVKIMNKELKSGISLKKKFYDLDSNM